MLAGFSAIDRSLFMLAGVSALCDSCSRVRVCVRRVGA